MCQDHPFITYIEDPFADADIDGFKKFKEALGEANLGHVKIGMKHIFRDSTLVKVQEITSIRPLTAEEQKAEKDHKDEVASRPPTNEAPAKGGRGGAAAASSNAASQLNTYKSPNADKFIPGCVSIRTSPLSTISDLFDFVRQSASMSDDNRFSLIIDD